MLTFEQRHEGAIGGRGKFKGYLPENENGEIKKDGTYEHKHMDWDKHLEGQEYFGLSPVKIVFNGTERKGLCRWIAWDLDFEQEPEIFCRAVFKIANDLLHKNTRKYLRKYLQV